MNLLRITALSSLIVAGHAWAEIYKHVDENGRVTYSNIPIKGAKKIVIEPATTVPAPRAPAGNGNKAQPSASPADFPRVDSKTQKDRDDIRRRILEEELKTEDKALADARVALKEGEATRVGIERSNYQRYLDRVQQLKDDVARHEANIAAIKKELSNLR